MNTLVPAFVTLRNYIESLYNKSENRNFIDRTMSFSLHIELDRFDYKESYDFNGISDTNESWLGVTLNNLVLIRNVESKNSKETYKASYTYTLDKVLLCYSHGGQDDNYRFKSDCSYPITLLFVEKLLVDGVII